jgi:hypothetical protein
MWQLASQLDLDKELLHQMDIAGQQSLISRRGVTAQQSQKALPGSVFPLTHYCLAEVKD